MGTFGPGDVPDPLCGFEVDGLDLVFGDGRPLAPAVGLEVAVVDAVVGEVVGLHEVTLLPGDVDPVEVIVNELHWVPIHFSDQRA